MARRSIDGRRAIITGCSSGIGRQLALQMADRGCRLVINARREEKLIELAAQVRDQGGEAVIVAGDVTDPAVRQQMVETAEREFDGLDILVNNAGIGALGPFADADEDRLRRVMEVNFFAPAELTRLAIPVLEKGERPIVVNISSVLAHRAVPLKSEYCASKFALHGLSDAIRSEIQERGIDTLLVSPSTTASEFFDNVIEKQGDYKQMSKAQAPEYVARRTIRAIERGKHEIILSWSGWGLVWLDRLFPALADRLVSRFGK
ncbi:MAG: SDR family oxidoreductase [Pirellulaceae bacterium]